MKLTFPSCLRSSRFAALLLLALVASFTLPASAWNRLQATRFATLPPGTAHPEGITVVDPTGRAIAKLGDFDGIDRQGSPIGLLFPASPVFFGGFVYVTNLSLDLATSFGLPQAVDSQWAGQVTRHTIARLPALIPPLRGGQ
jgi:hypothetical protein